MPRPIDHLVIAVPDLGAASAFYRAIGFTVGGLNRHPWGTVNAIVQLDGTFLELIGLAEDAVAPALDDPAAPFAWAVASAVARGGGLAMVAFRSADADADAALFTAAGLGHGQRLDFGRSAEAPDGTRRDVSFSLAFISDPSLPEAGLFTCRHHHPENFWNPSVQRHANGAQRLDGVMLPAVEPGQHRHVLTTVCGTAPMGFRDRLRYDTGTGCIDVRACTGDMADAIPGRFASCGIVVEAIEPVRAGLVRAGVPYSDIGGAVMVPPGCAYGTALAFVPGPCHSLAEGETERHERPS